MTYTINGLGSDNSVAEPLQELRDDLLFCVSLQDFQEQWHQKDKHICRNSNSKTHFNLEDVETSS